MLPVEIENLARCGQDGQSWAAFDEFSHLVCSLIQDVLAVVHHQQGRGVLDLINHLVQQTRPTHRSEAQRIGEQIRQLVSGLPFEQREAFLLHEEAGFSVEEIADLTEVGKETAKSRLRYAVRKLRDALAESR